MPSMALEDQAPQRTLGAQIASRAVVPLPTSRVDPLLARWLLAPVILPLALGAGVVSTLAPKLAIIGCIGLALWGCVYWRQALAGYLVVGLTPLLAGIDRGHVVPFFRPSEALALVVGSALLARGMIGLQAGRALRLRLNRIELAILCMAVSNSVVPILWMLARQHPITTDDILYALVLWKYFGFYLIVRTAITTDQQILRCLWFAVAASCGVAVIAIMQSLGLFGIPHLLATYYAPFGYTNILGNSRGSSTLALPAATADLMIYSLAIVSGLWICHRQHRAALAVAAGLFVFGALSAGEFSSAIGLLIAVCCIALVTSYPRLLSLFVPAGGLALVVLRPVVERRLSGFDSVSGLPVSWTGRLQNLRSYFWPKLWSDWNFLLGVRPSARVPVSSQGTGYVWIESGYTWLLWGGGLPLLISFIFFVQVVGRTSWRVARQSRDPASAAGVAAFVAVIVITVLMIFDPHLTYRGAAEAFFALLAITGVPGRREQRRIEQGRVTARSPMEAGP